MVVLKGRGGLSITSVLVVIMLLLCVEILRQLHLRPLQVCDVEVLLIGGRFPWTIPIDGISRNKAMLEALVTIRT